MRFLPVVGMTLYSYVKDGAKMIFS
jgi:hypothetical protein